ncbi:MAG: tetratricopeptide repeat protein, partial [Bacteroidota bacterium]
MGFPYVGLCECYIEKGDFEKAIEYVHKALAVFSSFHPDNEMFGRCYIYIGRAYRGIKFQEDEAIKWFEKAVDNFKRADRPLGVADAYMNLGICYKEKKYDDQAIAYFEKALEILVPVMSEFDMSVSLAYQLLGELYLKHGDLDRAYYYYQKDLVLTDSLFSQGHPLVGNTYWGLGNYFLAKGDYSTARQWLLRSAESVIRFGETGSLVEARTLVSLGNCARDAGEQKAAFEYYDQALKIFVPNYAASPLAPECFLNIARLLTQQKQYEQARGYLADILEKVIAHRGQNYGTVAELWSAVGDTYFQERNYEKAIGWYERVLTFFSNFDDSSILPVLASAHRGKGNCLSHQFDRTGNEVDLAKAQQEFQAAFDLVEKIQATFQEETSKQDLMAANIAIVENALAALEKRMEKSPSENLAAEAFSWAEKAKARTLLEGLNENFAFAVAGIPDSLLRSESHLKADISVLQKRIFDHRNSLDSILIPTWNALIFDKKRDMNRLVKDLEKKHPEFARIKYNLSSAGAPEIQNRLLDPATALLEYFLGDSSIYIFTLTKNDPNGSGQTLRLDHLPKPKEFDAVWENLRTYLTDAGFRSTEFVMDSFAEASAKLYDWLLAAPLASLDPAVKNLIIVPDGALGYLPFDLLGKANGQPNFKTFDYLLRHFNLSYAYSANLLLEQSQRAAEPLGDLQLFA